MSRIQRKALIGFLIWNVLVFFLWIWCREGSVVRLEFTVTGNDHTMYCDDEKVAFFRVPENKRLTKGKAGVGLSQHSRPPLPTAPQEIGDFKVLDPETGDVLLENAYVNDFKDWFMLRGTFDLTPANRLRASTLVMGATGSEDWEDVTIQTTIYNPTEAFILFRVQDKKNYGRIKLRFWRELIAGFSYYQDGKQSYNHLKSLTESVEDNIRSFLLRFIKVYAVSVSILIAFLALFTVVSLILRPFAGTIDRKEQ